MRERLGRSGAFDLNTKDASYIITKDSTLVSYPIIAIYSLSFILNFTFSFLVHLPEPKANIYKYARVHPSIADIQGISEVDTTGTGLPDALRRPGSD